MPTLVKPISEDDRERSISPQNHVVRLIEHGLASWTTLICSKEGFRARDCRIRHCETALLIRLCTCEGPVAARTAHHKRCLVEIQVPMSSVGKKRHNVARTSAQKHPQKPARRHCRFDQRTTTRRDYRSPVKHERLATFQPCGCIERCCMVSAVEAHRCRPRS